MTLLCGFDIGGTKCAVVLARRTDDSVEIIHKVKFPTPSTSDLTLARLSQELAGFLRNHPDAGLSAIGISCGGPLDSKRGLILSPPNLPGWECVDIVTSFQKAFAVPVALQNDANACALAEWKWGAGRGYENMVFLTFGTGMGAGLILDGRLYTGTNDMAGEVGHVRLAEDGPSGYGKAGSFEGFCSGGGIGRLARERARELLLQGKAPGFCPNEEAIASVTAETVGIAASSGDPAARAIYAEVGHMLGRGLAVLIDILNPQRIVIGSIYARQRNLLEQPVLDVLKRESLSLSLSVCTIVPAGLGEHVGDFASLSVAEHALAAR